ncbi:MAG: hypothetical protein CVU04_03705 [Bacteroidetes bacterium HGW-Bacteroidetes-20]|nr:MAG: hypothetical protein CVU04_03705 [Bacteroidetes bacterium HGW-Bacteroidetes-20]
MKKTILFLLLTCIISAQLVSQSYIQVGTGTVSNSQPFYGSWNNTWTRTLYFQSDLGTAKTITEIGFDMISAAPLTMTSQKIYLKHSSATDLVVSYEDPLTNGYTLVFDGTINFQTTGWNMIDITDFAYNGTDNLVMIVEDRNNASHYKNFNCTNYTGTRIVEAGCDPTSCFPMSSAYEPYPKAYPNTRFYYATSGPATPSNPYPSDNATKVLADTTIYFSLGANTSSYDLYFSTDSALVMILDASTRVVNNGIVSGAGVYSYTNPTMLNSKTKYFWRVVAKNGTVTENSPLWKFTTQLIINSFPYTQGFEDSTIFYPGWYGSFTDWSYISIGNNSIWNLATGLNPHTGSYCAVASPNSGTTSSALMTPRLIIPAGYRISFFWRNGSSARIAGTDSCFFEISTNGGTSWVTLDTLSPLVAQTQYVQAMHDLSSYAGNNVYFRWRYNLTTYSGSKYVYLDDIVIDPSVNNAEIQLSTSAISFPNICIGGYTSSKLYITNTGVQDLVITGANVTAPFSCNYTGTIAPGATDSAVVVFTPTTAGSVTGSLSFIITGSYSGINALSLSGNGLNTIQTFFESFDLSTNLPSGWNKLKSSYEVNHDVTIITSSDAYSAPNCAKILNFNDSISPLIMITPGTTNFNTNTLKFRAKTGGVYTQDLIIGYMADPYDASTFVADTTLVINDNYQLYIVYPNATNTLPYIGFKHGQNNKIRSFRIDDVSWESNAANPPLPASAIYPTHLATNVDIMTGVTLKWANGGGNPAGYRVYFGNTTPSMTLVTDTVGQTCTLNTILSYNTTYFWQVIPYNQYGTDSIACPVFSFNTMADPTKTLPWSENFDTLTQQPGNTYPLGWSTLNLPVEPNQTYLGECWDIIVNNSQNPNNAYSAPNAMVSGPEFYEKNNWLFTPPISINPASGNCLLTFWYKAVPSGVSNDIESMRVTLGTNHNITSIIDTLWNNDAITNSSYLMGSVVFTVPSSANYFLGFQAHSPSNYPTVQNFALLLDNVSVTYYSSVEELPFIVGVYPNPATDYLIVSAPELSMTSSLLELYDMNGKKLWTRNMNNGNVEISLDGISKGLYLLKVYANNKFTTVKVVVK